METTQRYRLARRHVERRIGFFIHLGVYLTVNAGLVALNLFTVPTRPWSVWPLLGWGVGLLFHALAVFLHAPGARWKERMIANEMNKIRSPE
ncbi:MAG TPA: 2TM domain-containing protein [Noviherbaspirillum sp.]|nr:2TM domain-containing protein [Noviherbaspirillum sp.]